jgi:Na+/H+ antiporter NhaA
MENGKNLLFVYILILWNLYCFNNLKYSIENLPIWFIWFYLVALFTGIGFTYAAFIGVIYKALITRPYYELKQLGYGQI